MLDRSASEHRSDSTESEYKAIDHIEEEINLGECDEEKRGDEPTISCTLSTQSSVVWWRLVIDDADTNREGEVRSLIIIIGLIFYTLIMLSFYYAYGSLKV